VIVGKNLMARYRALVRWVEQERRRLERTGGRKTQRYLRRARLMLEVDELQGASCTSWSR